LAVRELVRTGAFDREILRVLTTTGSGWINPKVAASLEYLHGGDTAKVAMQYSFLPSAVSLLVDKMKAREARKELIGAVLRRVDELPATERPKVRCTARARGRTGPSRHSTTWPSCVRRSTARFSVCRRSPTRSGSS